MKQFQPIAPSVNRKPPASDFRHVTSHEPPPRSTSPAPRFLTAGLLTLLSTMIALPAETNAPSPLDFQAFKIISERNIFDKNRQPQSPDRRSRSTEARPPRVETFHLAGTLIHEDGSYAFFNGSDSKYRTVLTPGRTIANFTVAEISQTSVKLKAGDHLVELDLGLQMRKQGDAPWELILKPTPGEKSTSTTSTDAGSTDADSSASGEDDPVLRKLMERRRQEQEK